MAKTNVWLKDFVALTLAILLFLNRVTIIIFYSLQPNGLRYEHVAGFGVLNYQNTPKLDAGLKAK